MGLNNWFKKQAAILSLALSNLEKNTLHNTGELISDDVGTVQLHKQGMLSDDLIQGKLTEEVIQLRARIYKVLNEAEKYTYKSGERGIKVDKSIPKNIIGEPSDVLAVELVVNNTAFMSNLMSSSNNIDAKGEKTIVVTRNCIPKFKIEQYSEKLYIKKYDENKKMLEFFIPKYVDVYDRKTNMLIAEIKRGINNPKSIDLLDITEVGFISNNTIGTTNYNEFLYTIDKFYKIIEYEGWYVIKFIATPTVNGVSIVEKYRNEKLDNAYNNKEPKKKK